MASKIDPTKPTTSVAFTADVRANFLAAKTEIEANTTGITGAINTANNALLIANDAQTDADTALALASSSIPAAGVTPLSQATDVNPFYHLTKWSSGGTKKVVIIGDSTSTDLPAPNYSMDSTQTMWGALKSEIARQNPQCYFTFVNRGISATNWAHPMMTANDRGQDVLVPDWYYNRDKVWLTYVQDEMPDTVFFLLGTNAPSANTALFIGDVMTAIAGWIKTPDVIMITNKTANAEAGSNFLSDQEYYKATSAFLRTFARTNGNGFAGFSNLRFGLLDPGRHYNARAFGKDFAYQYMSKVTSAIQNGLTLTGPIPSVKTLIGNTTDGDLRMTLVFVGAGGTVMYGVCGTSGFYITISAQTSNRIHIGLTSGGVWFARHQLTGTDSAPAVTGILNFSPPAGDVTMLVVLKGELVQISLNGTVILDVRVPRFICQSDITISSALAPVGTMTFNVTEFYEGIGSQVLKTIDPGTAFGQAGGPTAGNDINHPSSSTVAMIDYQVIASTNWSVPQITVEDDEVQLYSTAAIVGNGADTTADIIGQFTLNGRQLKNIGDTITIDVGGQIAASADVKNIWVRWNDPAAGLALWTTTGSGGSLCHWSASITIVKASDNVQQCKAQGSTTSANFLGGTITNQAGIADTNPIPIYVVGQNATTATANSVTCRIFRVSFTKAPGT